VVVLVCRPVPRPFTLVIVHWNQAEACARTLDRFAAQGTEVRALVVDNGSRPDQLEALREAVAARGGTRLVEQGHNSGFGPGANAGLRRWLADDDTEWCLLAPHDAEPAPDCLARLDRALAGEPLAGLACADVGDGMVPMLDPYFGGITRRATRSEGWEDADYPHGTLMALRRGCVEEIGLFEESYFAYCEEADLGRRALDAGWKIGIVHGARVTNTHLGTSVAAVDYLMERNAFGAPLAANQYLQFTLAELTAEMEMVRSLNYRAAAAMIAGEDVTRLATIAKLTSARSLRRVADWCLQFHGGIGFMEETWTARFFRDARLWSIGGGADEVMLRQLARMDGYAPPRS